MSTHLVLSDIKYLVITTYTTRLLKTCSKPFPKRPSHIPCGVYMPYSQQQRREPLHVSGIMVYIRSFSVPMPMPMLMLMPMTIGSQTPRYPKRKCRPISTPNLNGWSLLCEYIGD